MRGAVPRQDVVAARLGIIPARAGSRRCRTPCGHATRDHPRACGEQADVFFGQPEERGSSPRVRGADGDIWVSDYSDGIIPARAGSRSLCTRENNQHRDHPRACGEQPRRSPTSPTPAGSSPRVRGAGGNADAQNMPRGIIPARAGSSRPRRRARTCGRDHPRACGEQSSHSHLMLSPVGSSPRVRGAVSPIGILWQLDGIIPARAGSREHGPHTMRLKRDHPRACGEQMRADA